MRVLIIDDDALYAGWLAALFTRHGFEVETTQDPRDGLELLREKSFDILLLDLFMPYFDGLEFLRAFPRTADRPLIVLITGASLQDACVKAALAFGADTVVSKSRKPSDLLTAVHRLARDRGSCLEPLAVAQPCL